MTTPRDPDRLIRAFLDEGPRELPDRTYDALRGDLDRTRQRVVIGPWRESHMNSIAKLAIAFAAVVVVAFAGLNLLPGQGGSGGAGASPSPTASPSPSPTPSTNPSAAVQYLPPEGILAAGTYDAISEADLVPFTFTVPDGWRSVGWFLTNDPGQAPYNLRLTFLPVGNLYADPCQGTLATPPIGPSVDDLAAGLMALPGTTAAATKDVVLDGRAAKLVEYTIRTDNTCALDRFYLSRDFGEGDFWTFPPYGDTVRTWILDVDGHRFVMMADVQAGVTEVDKAQLQDVIDSVTFGR